MSNYVIGKHPARACPGAQLGAASTGTPQVGVEFEFTEGPNAGKRITWYGFLSDSTFDRTVEALRAAGWTGDMLDDLSSLGGPDAPVVQLVLDEEEYNGTRRAKVQWVNKLGGLAMKGAFKPEESKSFAERMKARVQTADRTRAAGSKPPAAQSRPAAPPTPPADDLDIPF